VSRRASAIALAVVVLGVAAAPAAADHSDTVHITDDAAYVLRPGEVRLGIWKAQVGVPVKPLRGLEVGSYLLPWALWAADIRAVNFHGKYQFADHGDWSATVAAGLFYLSLENHDLPVRFAGIPFEVLGARRVSQAVTLGGGLQGAYVRTSGEGAYDEGKLRGALAANSLQLLTTLEWRLSRVTALVGSARLVTFNNVSGSGDVRAMIDSHTTVEAMGAGDADIDGGFGGQVGAYVHFSWTRFNFKLGGTYGTYTIPGINFIIPTRIFMPEFDLFWRF
jgi:hypothetical protein